MKVVLDLGITEIPGTNMWRAPHLLTLAIRFISNTSTTEFDHCIIAHNDRGDIRKGEIRSEVRGLAVLYSLCRDQPCDIDRTREIALEYSDRYTRNVHVVYRKRDPLYCTE
jgi:hypothetical protein